MSGFLEALFGQDRKNQTDDSSDEGNYVEKGNIECYNRESAENDSYDTKYLVACFHCYILLNIILISSVLAAVMIIFYLIFNVKYCAIFLLLIYKIVIGFMPRS